MLDKNMNRKKKLAIINAWLPSQREKNFRELSYDELKSYWNIGLKGEAYKDYMNVLMEKKNEVNQ